MSMSPECIPYGISSLNIPRGWRGSLITFANFSWRCYSDAHPLGLPAWSAEPPHLKAFCITLPGDLLISLYNSHSPIGDQVLNA